jgi:hypothetical protein
MKRLILLFFFCLSFITPAWGDESWIFFHSDKEYYFEPPNIGIPLKPLYQRETYYYDESSLQISGYLLWKIVKAKVKIESWGIYSNKESLTLWEVDCEKKAVRKYNKDSRPISSLAVDSGDESVDDFYKALCL